MLDNSAHALIAVIERVQGIERGVKYRNAGHRSILLQPRDELSYACGDCSIGRRNVIAYSDQVIVAPCARLIRREIREMRVKHIHAERETAMNAPQKGGSKLAEVKRPLVERAKCFGNVEKFQLFVIPYRELLSRA